MDLANSRELGRWLNTLIKPRQRLEVDLSGLEFMDSAGLLALITAHPLALGCDCELLLVAPSGQVQRLLQLTRCVDIFTVIPASVDLSDEPQASGQMMRARRAVRRGL